MQYLYIDEDKQKEDEEIEDEEDDRDLQCGYVLKCVYGYFIVNGDVNYNENYHGHPPHLYYHCFAPDPFWESLDDGYDMSRMKGYMKYDPIDGAPYNEEHDDTIFCGRFKKFMYASRVGILELLCDEAKELLKDPSYDLKEE